MNSFSACLCSILCTVMNYISSVLAGHLFLTLCMFSLFVSLCYDSEAVWIARSESWREYILGSCYAEMVVAAGQKSDIRLAVDHARPAEQQRMGRSARHWQLRVKHHPQQQEIFVGLFPTSRKHCQNITITIASLNHYQQLPTYWLQYRARCVA